MGARFRSWWKITSKTLKIVQIIGLIVVVGLIVSFIGGYFFNWPWTGFGPYTPPTSNFQREKTLYDWLQLAIIPIALSFGIWWLTRLQQQRDQQLADRRAQTEREISLDNQHEAALQAYIDNMSALLLEKDLREPVALDKVRKIARVRTLTVLPRCDGRRKAIVLNFLYESGLIENDKSIVDLSAADFSSANLVAFNLSGADLSEVNLREANLFGAYLSGTNLHLATLTAANLFQAILRGANLEKAFLDGGADLSFADLSGANLQGAILKGTNLLGTKVTSEQLDEATFFEGLYIRSHFLRGI